MRETLPLDRAENLVRPATIAGLGNWARDDNVTPGPWITDEITGKMPEPALLRRMGAACRSALLDLACRAVQHGRNRAHLIGGQRTVPEPDR